MRAEVAPYFVKRAHVFSAAAEAAAVAAQR